MSPRAILFDLFDTLVDLEMERLQDGEARPYSTYEALHSIMVQRIDVDFETFAQELGAVDREVKARLTEQGREFPTRERFAALTRRLEIEDPELVEALTETHMGKLESLTSTLPHHPQVLRGLAGSAKLGICSNFSHAPTARRVLERAELIPHLDAIVISEEVGIRKPRPEIFRATLERLGVDAADAIHVGDNLRADIAGAAQAGIRTVWITRRVRDPNQRLLQYQGRAPDWTIADLAELPGLL